jgi:hypothetical protein
MPLRHHHTIEAPTGPGSAAATPPDAGLTLSRP